MARPLRIEFAGALYHVHRDDATAAGHDITLRAKQSSPLAANGGEDRGEGAIQTGNLTVVGSDIKAGRNVSLEADHKITLLAAQNSASQTSTNSSSSNSIGVGFALGGQSNGFTLNLAASRARGNADGSDVNWNNTHVDAGNQLTLKSGNDTTLKGAVARGKQITADIGGPSTGSGQAKLIIESLQDTSTYTSKQSSAGIGLNLCIPPFCYGASSGSVSASKSKANSDYASVTEQSGLRAGDAGFNVSVQGNTDLTGGAITSTQAALDENRNRFTTGGALTTSDIQNRANYSAKAVGVNLGTGVSLDGKLAPQGTSAGLGRDSGNASSLTQAAITGIAGNKEARTGDAETGLGQIFDADKVQKEISAQVQITQEFGRQAGRAVDDYTEKQMSTLRERYAAETDPEKQQALQAEVDQLRLETHVLNVLIGGVTGMGGIALTKESLSAAAEEMRQITTENSKLFAGVTDGATILSNVSGVSVGGKWDLDPTKTGGTRVDLDGVCGADNKRCMTKDDGNGNEILDLKNGMVQWNSDGADGKSLAEWLKTDEGQKMAGLTGGIQGMKGMLFGEPYAAGSWQDKLIEAFGGTHDVIGGQVVGLYDEQGNARRGRSDSEKITHEVWSVAAIAPATPFAMAELLPPEVWKAISILLGAAK